MPDASTEPTTPYRALLDELREIAVLASIQLTLNWDQEVMMPSAAAALRGEQAAMLSALAHERGTSQRMADLIAGAEADAETMADPASAANVRHTRRDFERATRLPVDLVRDEAETSTRAMHAWREHREANDFASFAPWLQKIVEINRRKAECYGIPDGGELYDALLDTFEPGMRAAELDRVFRELRDGLVPLIRELRENGTAP